MNGDWVPAGPFDSWDRRSFLIASGAAVSGWAARRGEASTPAAGATARSTILFFLCGGASHIDMWDMKPEAPAEYRGVFQPIATTAPAIRLCEHLPLTARQAHRLAVVNSVGASVNTNDHHAGYYYNLTGRAPDESFLTLGNSRTPMLDDWPFMGSVIAARRPNRNGLPNAVTLPHKPSKAPYTRPEQFAGKLGAEYDPFYVSGNRETPAEFRAPSLALRGELTADRMLDRRGLLQVVDGARRTAERFAAPPGWSKHQERAFSLLTSSETMRAFDLSAESPDLLDRYGRTINGMSLLAARRLVEAGVPFVTVFWKEDEKLIDKCKSAGGWDTHGDNFNCLKDDLLPEFDRCFSALIEDLARLGLLETTLVLVTSEMGRTPRIGDVRSGGVAGAGRDHWTHCLTDVLAGGGVQGGRVYGKSDARAEYPADKPVTPAHVARTVYHAMGVRDLSARDSLGRPYDLLEEGAVLEYLF